jgi:hypothetical protein
MERKTRSALVSGSLPPVFEATPSQPREVQQKNAGFGSFWNLPLYKSDSPMKMVRAEGAIGWINSGDLPCPAILKQPLQNCSQNRSQQQD